ncbi:MAG TPA: LCP family protein [Pseudonocardiaceae bacterium]|nr:LCP family protein [Pseudonocardiaceae bacterium]
MLRHPAKGAGLLRRWLRLVGRTGVVLASAAALIMTGYAWTLSRQFDASLTTSAVLDHSGHADRAYRAGPAGPMNVLLVGLDSRTDAQGNLLSPQVLAALHAGGNSGELNADTLILVHVAAEPTQPTVAVSIPRDSYVTVPGFGAHKINSAYRRGMLDAKPTLAAQGINGPELERLARQAGARKLVQTVEQLTGVTLDHYAEINLAGFYDITQAVGGVPVCLTAPVHDSYSGADFPAGPQTVSGAAALAFVRQRHGLPRGDLDRIARQQAYLSGLTDRLISGGVLTNPNTLAAMREAIARYVVIDPGWDLTGLIEQARAMSEESVRFQTIPTGRTNLSTPDGEAVHVDRAQVQQFVAQLTNPGDHPLNPPVSATPATPASAPIATSMPCIN